VDSLIGLAIILAGFGLVALASRQLGRYLSRVRLPLITGFLLCGIVAGPHVLGFIPEDGLEKLRFLDQLCLGFIAFAAGCELHYREVKRRLKSIAWITTGLVVVTFTLGSVALILLAPYIPFARDLPPAGRVAVALLGGAIMVARSPSSAIAVVAELRARGRFTQTILGVTVLMDVVVIVVFAVNSSFADALFAGLGLDLRFAALLIGELALSVLLGYVLGKFLQAIFFGTAPRTLKATMLVVTGLSVFLLTERIREIAHDVAGVDVHVEPLLVCMLGAFYLANFTAYRAELDQVVKDIGPAIFILFFTLTGASLDLGVLGATWSIALVLFGVRLVSLFIGTTAGSWLAGDPPQHRRVGWLSFVTQAGIGLGLAKEAAVEFPEFGMPFATLMTAMIVLNQLVGPPLFKWSLHRVGEARRGRDGRRLERPRDVIIFGLESQSVALARKLVSHDWRPRIASRTAADEDAHELAELGVDVRPVDDLSVDTLRDLGVGEADAIVAMLSDAKNLELCRIVNEHFDDKNVIVRLHHIAAYEPYRSLGARVVEPASAVVGILDRFVRAPDAASIIMGLEEDEQDIIGLRMSNPANDGVAIRDVGLPLDVHILSIRRKGHFVMLEGYNPLVFGDLLTLTGPPDSLERARRLFEGD